MADLEAKVEALAVSDAKPAAPKEKKEKKAPAAAGGAPLEVRLHHRDALDFLARG